MAESIKNLEKVFKALGNRRRLAILRLLSKGKEKSVSDIAGYIGLSFTSTSKHLILLHQLDILERRQISLSMYYRLTKSPPTVVERVLYYISNSRE